MFNGLQMTIFVGVAYTITSMFLPFVFNNDDNWTKYLYQEFATMVIYKIIIPIFKERSVWYLICKNSDIKC